MVYIFYYLIAGRDDKIRSTLFGPPRAINKIQINIKFYSFNFEKFGSKYFYLHFFYEIYALYIFRFAVM